MNFITSLTHFFFCWGETLLTLKLRNIDSYVFFLEKTLLTLFF